MVTIVDSGVWIDYFRGRTTRATRLLARLLAAGKPLYVTDVVYGELLAGDPTTSERGIIETLRRDSWVVSLHDLDDMARAAACRRAARRAGSPVRSFADCLIASVCIREGATLLHDDRDFRTLASCTELRELVP